MVHKTTICLFFIFPYPDRLSLLILKVIICTDGKANTELGNLEVEDNDARTLLSSTIFYQELGEYAANQGLVHISLSVSRMEQAFIYCIAFVVLLHRKFTSTCLKPCCSTNIITMVLIFVLLNGQMGEGGFVMFCHEVHTVMSSFY